MSLMENCFTFQELHNTLCSQVDNYFSDLQNAVPENSTIFLIRDYISKNYGMRPYPSRISAIMCFCLPPMYVPFSKMKPGRLSISI